MSDFRHSAACRDADPELFFPIGDGGPTAKQTDEALFVCYRCPVRAACLDWALCTGQSEGIWGGHTPAERRALHRGRVRAAPSWTR
ncbi:MAG TPA: WhiB family transcriptional regulator [Pseudonocardia sp.]|uniref:WhiB family transcriptional regulator n=1 Tax=Pseudonocardia sp. TaxID=60912 RepID=UPI002CB98997|nr:WhiB family transcriptional regulator [Pseudonocardia sp.]HTF54142.1 WhiB family transcriptional regulator [Pseudonocardia sp.]